MQPFSLNWPGGRNQFRLRLGELRALQTARDAGPEEIFIRLRTGKWQPDDFIQVIRWGLAGGGDMPADEAATMVTALVDLHPLAEFKVCALAILGHALFGPGDDQLGKGEGAAEAPPENGGSPTSTAAVP